MNQRVLCVFVFLLPPPLVVLGVLCKQRMMWPFFFFFYNLQLTFWGLFDSFVGPN